MNIVFFDVDGVLNSKEYIMNTGPLKKGEVGGLDPLALAHFERLATVPNTIFVMSCHGDVKDYAMCKMSFSKLGSAATSQV